MYKLIKERVGCDSVRMHWIFINLTIISRMKAYLLFLFIFGISALWSGLHLKNDLKGMLGTLRCAPPRCRGNLSMTRTGCEAKRAGLQSRGANYAYAVRLQ